MENKILKKILNEIKDGQTIKALMDLTAYISGSVSITKPQLSEDLWEMNRYIIKNFDF